MINGKQDKSAAATIKSAYAVQCERGNWDVTGQHGRPGFSRLGVRTVAQDGEVLIRIHEYGPDSPTGFAVELIDAEALDIDYNDVLPGGNVIRMGVEMTPRRRPVAYWLFSEPDRPHGGYRQTQRVRVPAEQLLHIYLPEWVWGSRGIPWAVTALRRLKMLGGYEEAAITAARAAAVKTAVYTQQEWADPNIGPASTDIDSEMVQDLTPGAIEIAPRGYDLKPLDWSWPNTEHGEFVKESLRGIAAGLGVSYNLLANDLEGVTFSSLRQGALAERDLWMMLQDWWIDWVERPIYRRWLSFAVRDGSVRHRNGGMYIPSREPTLSHATFQGRRWPWVDPEKDLKSAKLAISLGTRSVSDVIRESGRDPEEVWTELAEDLEQLKVLGLSLTDILTPRDSSPPDREESEELNE